MFIPTFDDNIGILIDYSLDLAKIARFDTLFLRKDELYTIPLELSYSAVALYVDMKWLVFLAVEKEREPEKSKYFWHLSIVYYIFLCKDRNYF
jgi:hypothetical protein